MRAPMAFRLAFAGAGSRSGAILIFGEQPPDDTDAVSKAQSAVGQFLRKRVFRALLDEIGRKQRLFRAISSVLCKVRPLYHYKSTR